MPNCIQCQSPFEWTEADKALLNKMTPVFGDKEYRLPDPKLCFQCRLQRRLAFYNSRAIYKRTCNLTQKTIASVYSPDKPHTVYNKEDWYGDKWDPLSFGMEYDFNRSFFEQFQELMQRVPALSLAQLGNVQNSEFTNDNLKLKNCYLVFDGEQAEDCYHGHSFVNIRSCMDFVYLVNCEVCFEVVHCIDCYNLQWSQHCKNCNDSHFLKDCIGCTNCFGCVNLRQKQYCIFNEQKTKEEYESFMQSFVTTSWSAVQNMRKQVQEFFLQFPVKAVRGEQNVDCYGDNLNNSKNSVQCFDCNEQQDCRYCTDCMMPAKDNLDVHIWGNGLELTYNSCVCGENSRNIVSGYYVSQGCSNVYYSCFCSRSSTNLFGCIGLRHKNHCILNKQYTPEQYAEITAKIVEQMQFQGQWGEFFSPETSAFGYNETMAQTFFPLTKEQAEQRGFQWSDYEAPIEATKTIQASQLPDDQTAVPDDVLNWAIICEVTARPFKIVKQELDFCRTHKVPLPRRHPDQRHADRFAHKNPYILWDRRCAKCNKDMQTSYAPDRPEIVWCEECFLKEVY